MQLFSNAVNKSRSCVDGEVLTVCFLKPQVKHQAFSVTIKCLCN